MTSRYRVASALPFTKFLNYSLEYVENKFKLNWNEIEYCIIYVGKFIYASQFVYTGY